MSFEEIVGIISAIIITFAVVAWLFVFLKYFLDYSRKEDNRKAKLCKAIIDYLEAHTNK